MGSIHLVYLSYFIKFKFITNFNLFNFCSFAIFYVILKCYSGLRILSYQYKLKLFKYYLYDKRSNNPYTYYIFASDFVIFTDNTSIFIGQNTLNIFLYPPKWVFDKFKYIFGNFIIGASSSSYIPSTPSYYKYNLFPSYTCAN